MKKDMQVVPVPIGVTAVTVESNCVTEAVNIFHLITSEERIDTIPELRISTLSFWVEGDINPRPQHTDMDDYEPEQVEEIIRDNWKKGMLVKMGFIKKGIEE